MRGTTLPRAINSAACPALREHASIGVIAGIHPRVSPRHSTRRGKNSYFFSDICYAI